MRTAVAAIVGWTSFASSAFAWEPIYDTFPTWNNGTVTYLLNRAGSEDLGSETEPLLRDAMEAWAEYSCADLSIIYGGLTDLEPVGMDGNSVLRFVEEGWPDDQIGVLGVTSSRFNGNRLIEADISFNADHWTWTTGQGDLSNWTCNAATIISHEGGHFFGIGHSEDADALMFPAYSGGITPIGADDEEAICSLYPIDGPAPADCSVSGCPAGEECVGGVCVDTTGPRVSGPGAPDGGVPSLSAGTLGASCEFNTDCGSGLCIDHRGGRFCTKPCAGGCGTGFECVTYESTELCLPSAGGGASSGTIRGGCSAGMGRAGWSATVLLLCTLLYRRRTQRTGARRFFK